jgi:hypothetical protein
VTRRLQDLPSFPLREHGSPERVERIWRRLAPELGAAPMWARPQTFWAPAALVAVFGAGVFVGARWVRPDVAPTLSAERPQAVEPGAGPHAPQPATRVPAAHPRAQPAHHLRTTGVVTPLLVAPSKPVAPVASIAPTATTPSWERLAEAGDFEAAHAALAAQGSFESVLRTATAPELMALVDIARASGSREHAVAALRRVVEVFRDAPEAPLAAWTLANLLDQSGDGAASDAYALYRRLSPGGDFAEDALAREVDLALSQGNLELSARLIAQYENEFPNGRSLEEFRSELARRAERAAGTQSGEASTDPAVPADPGHAEGAPTKPRSDEPVPPVVKPTAK